MSPPKSKPPKASIVNRNEFLRILDLVSPGLSERDIAEQSSCFAFKNGKVGTFNGEVMCICDVPLSLTGAVAAAPMLQILRRLEDEEVEISTTDEELLIQGKRRKTGIRLEAEVLLPLKQVGKPDEWLELPTTFTEAIGLVHQCASTDQSEFNLSCVHITRNGIEASDNFQIAKYRLKMPFKSSVLVRSHAIKHVVPADVTEVGLTDSFIHFRNSNGLRIACRRYLESFPEIDPLLELPDPKADITFPSSLANAAERAAVFASATAGSTDYITVELKRDRMRVYGEGATGWHEETKKVRYRGRDMSFVIKAKLLAELVKRHNDCVIAANRLQVISGKFVYVACLNIDEESK